VCVTVFLYMYSLVCATVLPRVRDCTRSCAPPYSIMCAAVLARLRAVLAHVRHSTRVVYITKLYVEGKELAVLT
jgi:hypothetical protein